MDNKYVQPSLSASGSENMLATLLSLWQFLTLDRLYQGEPYIGTGNLDHGHNKQYAGMDALLTHHLFQDALGAHTPVFAVGTESIVGSPDLPRSFDPPLVSLGRGCVLSSQRAGDILYDENLGYRKHGD